MLSGPPGEVAGLVGVTGSMTKDSIQMNFFPGTDHGAPISYYVIQKMNEHREEWELVEESTSSSFPFGRSKSSCIIYSLLVPYRLAGGTLSLLAVCLSVCLSVTLRFSGLFSAVVWDIDLKFGFMNLLWHNTDQVWVLSRLTYFYRSYCPL